MKIPNTLFFRTASTLLLSLLLLFIVFAATTAYFVTVPVGKRSADDLAALLVLAAKTWIELPPGTRPDFVDELRVAHGIRLVEGGQQLEAGASLPIPIYLRLLQRALERRLGERVPVTLGVDRSQPTWIWISLPIRDEQIRFGISAARIGARPPVALIAMAVAILVLAVGTALVLARQLTKPLEALSRATSTIGRGERVPLPEQSGPEEIQLLARNFNRMAREVAELLENRTTLLAGISHDLRTPLTRLRLALEVDARSMDAQLRLQLEQNIEEMEQLLEQALQLARGINRGERPEPVDLVALLSTLVSQLEAQCLQQSGPHCRILFETGPAVGASLVCHLPRQSLLRVLRNLLDNALRYGGQEPVTVRLEWRQGRPLITILDRGPGIPGLERGNVFRPFYRLEQSRSPETGGSGLGLAIVQQLCQAAGWEISLHAGPEGGNEARLWLCKTADKDLWH